MKEMTNNVINKILPEENNKVTEDIKRLKSSPDLFSYYNGDGNKRVLKVAEILKSSPGKDYKSDDNNISINKLRELKQAYEEGLISEEEFENSKKKFLNK